MGQANRLLCKCNQTGNITTVWQRSVTCMSTPHVSFLERFATHISICWLGGGDANAPAKNLPLSETLDCCQLHLSTLFSACSFSGSCLHHGNLPTSRSNNQLWGCYEIECSSGGHPLGLNRCCLEADTTHFASMKCLHVSQKELSIEG